MSTMDYTGLSLDRTVSLHGKRHPLTGELLRPLGLRANGRPIWPVMGGSTAADVDEDTSSKEDPDDKKGSDDSKDKEGSEDTSGSDEKKDDADKKPEPGSVEARLLALEDEKERHYRLRKEAEEERDRLAAENKELKGKDLPELDKVKADLEEAKSDATSLSAQLKQALLEKAFLEDNTYTWHNPSRALQIADLTRVEFDKDGKVTGLAQALESLAKTDPYLIKTEEKTEDKDGKDKKPDKSGDQKNDKSKDKKSSTTAERARLVAKYPGLAR